MIVWTVLEYPKRLTLDEWLDRWRHWGGNAPPCDITVHELIEVDLYTDDPWVAKLKELAESTK